MNPYTETAKLVGVALLACAVILGGQQILSWKRAAEQNETRGGVIVTTEGIQNDGAAADADRAATDYVVDDAANTFRETTARDRINEPQTATRDAALVPASRLRAFHARRLARERSDCVGEQCEPRPATEVATQR